MSRFNYAAACSKLMVPSIVNALTSVHEYRGRQEWYQDAAPETLDRLCEVAKIQSTESSNRLENISTSDLRLRDLMLDRTAPQNRNEREIIGYRYVLDLIHKSHPYIPVTPSVILQLHRDLYRALDVSFAGRWKDSDNVVGQRLPDGRVVARFVPTSAAATPDAIEELCCEYARSLEGPYDPLLPAFMFVFDFVSIHPFSDGNGRMSRLLTLLLLYKSGYLVGKYISVEREIETTKASYYEALGASSVGWETGSNDYAPFVEYMLGVILACYKELDRRVRLVGPAGSSEDLVLAYLKEQLTPATKRQIVEALPSLSAKTVERALQKLQKDGVVAKVGAARATAYRTI